MFYNQNPQQSLQTSLQKWDGLTATWETKEEKILGQEFIDKVPVMLLLMHQLKKKLS